MSFSNFLKSKSESLTNDKSLSNDTLNSNVTKQICKLTEPNCSSCYKDLQMSSHSTNLRTTCLELIKRAHLSNSTCLVHRFNDGEKEDKDSALKKWSIL